MSREDAPEYGGPKPTWTGIIVAGAVMFGAPIVLAFACTPKADAQKGASIVGVAKLKDADTFYIGAKEIRLHGYDTPEENKICGSTNVYVEANNAMRALVDGKQISCIDTGKKSNGRIVADCSVNGLDIGEQLVRQGWGRDWPKFSKGDYCPMEREARAAKRGLWGLSCPADLWSDNRGPRNYVNKKTGKVCS